MAGTGANSVPLGALHPVFSGGGKSSGNDSMLNAAREAAARVTANILKRDHAGIAARPAQAQSTATGGPVSAAHHPLTMPGQRQIIEPLMQASSSWPMQQQPETSKRRKRSRWGGEDVKAAPGVATVIPSGLSKEQETQVLLHLQIEELSRKLRTGELGVPPNVEDRSPSPEPIYNHEGKRLNTRDYRMRKKLEEDRHKMIQEALSLNPEYKPPADYKPPVQRVSDRVMIPQDQHPEINFVGLLIGPRGNTLKKLEKDTTTKIMIRGKGSVKEGKVGRKDGQPLPGEDEPLHALVTANNAESVKKAVIQIQEIIKQGIETPEGQNDLRRMQLRELARLNGTLRDEDMLRCSNCGSTEHRTWQCTEKQNITNNILCSLCGSAGHIAADCREKAIGDRPLAQPIVNSADKAKMDSEYLSLMAELGEGPLPGGGGGGPPPPPKVSLGGPPSGPRHPTPPISSAPPNRPLMMPPGGGQGNNQDHPPPLMGQNLNLPWNNRSQNKPPSLLNSGPAQRPPLGQGPPPPPLPHQGPPPPSSSGPPPHHNQPPFMGPPRPPLMNRPPPVGPPGGMPPNMMPSHMGQGPPGPPPGGFNPMMPPPPRGRSQLPPWAFHGGPPSSGSPNSSAPAPAPVPPPSLLVAPPPPPPSSEPPPQPPTSAPWQISSSSQGVGTSPPSQPPWQSQAILQQALALSQPQQAATATATTTETTTSTTKPSPPVPWQQLAAAAAAANAPPVSSASSSSPALPPWLQAYTAAAAAAAAAAGGGGVSTSTAGQPTPPQWAQAMPPPPPQPVPPPSLPGMPPMGVPPPHMQPPMPPLPFQQGGMSDVAPPPAVPPPHLNAPPPPPPPSS
ncbi:splicing factor 1-like isoform X1 [Lytechinus variegatus]|uniref:splicing factor 1-like isoform X1 n=1 Tax=Lytechinus variegatus TaxID=7654 RepID=UPI001BB0EAF9|nr:splicing factor 1-like isoform X1 [Lytechinus variegatus]